MGRPLIVEMPLAKAASLAAAAPSPELFRPSPETSITARVLSKSLLFSSLVANAIAEPTPVLPLKGRVVDSIKSAKMFASAADFSSVNGTFVVC